LVIFSIYLFGDVGDTQRVGDQCDGDLSLSGRRLSLFASPKDAGQRRPVVALPSSLARPHACE